MTDQPPSPMPMSLDAVLALIERCLANGESRKAEDLCRQVLSKLPTHLATTRLLLRSQITGGQSAEAETTRRRLLALEQINDAQTLQRHAMAELQKAKALLDQAVPHCLDVPAAAALRWEVGKSLGDTPWYYSQAGQDAYLHQHIFGNRRGGVFVDIGAYDGITGSNTLFFEQSLGWTGLCIEPVAEQFARLRQTRRAACLQLGIADRDGEAEFVSFHPNLSQMGGLRETYDDRMRQRALDTHKQTEITSRIAVRRLPPLLAEHNITQIDLLCIDVEGAEMLILRDLDLQGLAVSALLVENNHHDHVLRRSLADHGFYLHARLGVDDLFIRQGFVPQGA